MKRILTTSFLSALLCLCFTGTALSAQSLLNSPCKAVKSIHIQNSAHGEEAVKFATSIMKSKGILLFFMNPNGRPCQMQSQIIEESKSEIEKHFLIKYVKTTNSSDHALFYRFGVRSMPAIILLNKNGSVKYRFTPGIHSQEQLLNAMKQLN